MALLINDPFGGGQQEIDLGRSRIAPRETYSADPRAIEGQYRSQMAQVNQLTDALAGFGSTVGKIEQKQREEELKQTEVLAAQIMGQLDPKSPIGPQVASLTGDKSPLLRAAVNEAIGRQQAQMTAQQWVENMPEGVSDTPEKTQEYFRTKLAEEAARVGKDPFYGPAYVKTLTDAFERRSAQLSASRTQQMQAIVSQDQVNRMTTGGMDAITRSTTAAVPQEGRAILDFVARPESGGNYNAYIGNAKNQSIQLTNMTVAEVMAFQRDLVRRGNESGAVGRYQIIGKTLKGLVERMGIDPYNTKFSEEIQDRMAFELLKVRGFDRWKNGSISDTQFANELAKEWAGLPVVSGPNAGRSFYDGVGSNRSGVGSQTFLSAIQASREGVTGSTTAQQQASQAGTPAIRPDVKAVQDHLLAEDARYIAINGDTRLTRQTSKSNMISAAINIAVEKRDVEFLNAVPSNLLNPDEKAKIDKARQEINNMRWQEYQRQKTIENDIKAEQERQFKNNSTTKFVETGSIDPDKDSRNPDGTIDFEKRKFLIELQGTSSIPQERSIATAENLKQSVFDASTTGKWDAFKDDPVLGPTIAEGKQPTSQQLRDHILNRMDISGAQKADLLKNIEVQMQGGSLMQDQRVKTYYNDNVKSMIDGVLKNDAMAKVIAFKNPTMVADVQKVFNATVRRKIEEAIETKGTTPTGVELTKILEEAETKAIQRFETIMKYVERGKTAPSEQMQQSQTPQAQPQTQTPKGRFVTQPDGTKKFVRE